MSMIRKLDLVSSLIEGGRVRLGMTRTELQNTLGAPDDISFPQPEYYAPSIYKYGDVEFGFPDALTATDAQLQGLMLVYVDDSVDGADVPIFLLSSWGAKRRGE